MTDLKVLIWMWVVCNSLVTYLRKKMWNALWTIETEVQYLCRLYIYRTFASETSGFISVEMHVHNYNMTVALHVLIPNDVCVTVYIWRWYINDALQLRVCILELLFEMNMLVFLYGPQFGLMTWLLSRHIFFHRTVTSACFIK